MDPNTVAAMVAAAGAIAAALAAFVALKPAQRAARAAEEQTAVQRDLMFQAAQPYVWADIQPDNQQGMMLQLAVGNAGPSMARNIRVEIDPPIPGHPSSSGMAEIAQRRLREGLLSLAPGRTIRWSLGKASDLLQDKDDETVFRIRVTADGPYGEVEPVETEVRLRDWREARDAPDGSLHYVRGEIKNLTKAIEKLNDSISTTKR